LPQVDDVVMTPSTMRATPIVLTGTQIETQQSVDYFRSPPSR
jgi:hypothetical protein